MRTWTWSVDKGANVDHEISVKVARFGNGYEQVVGDGLNNVRQIWNIEKFGTQEQVFPAYNFIKEHRGAIPFQWETPLGEQILVRCQEYKMRHRGDLAYTLTATFEQVFKP